MKKNIKIISTLASVAVLVAMSSNISAAPIGTPAATPVNNTASIDYSVGGTNQTDIYSSPTGNSTPGVPGVDPGAPTVAATQTSFVVDEKVDLLVTGTTTPVNVVPGQTGAADNTELSFTVTNEGNSTKTFSLSPSDNFTIGPGDEFNTSNCAVTAPTNPTSVIIASGDVVNVTVECDIPASSATVTNGAQSLVDLLAEVTGVTASTGADNPATVETVFADGTGTSTDSGDRNAQHSATSLYAINTADLTVQKTEALTAMNIDLNNDGDFLDPGETNATGYHIPGSTIEYTITVVNAAGAATATGINITDTVPAELTIVGTPTLDVAGTAGTASATGNAVSTTPFDLNAGETATLTITATVN